ncbi:maltooligosyl trehalose hydrolase [Pontibacter ummariensis]|uniref:Malto-oligosyltrehalose trehalohydrolase n=1 Tax=Pontibacter ummariensis TaxID=1610492 RepID=A0A239BZR6_9BACT|nr:malto-oligosyltrehalose trehalohydrolase [Pontibacter ummariensis]PRY15527.1 maltooligosyl trehalose hydrolase [Pontibacter ummariensis]SNS13380.1 maltooligosyl trehalose hydrolase [Pontibacter ummariensis]
MKIVGAEYTGNGHCRFTVWAPEKERMVLHLVQPEDRLVEMDRATWGYFTVELDNLYPGARYFYRPEGEKDYPDPASYYQPEGVHGPSEVIDHASHLWRDTSWQNLPLQDLVLYELHVGTFTPEGTFEAIIPRLEELKETGINALELMPVAQFPGDRNWGYDGTYPYAVQQSYGGPEGLKKLVDACHAQGIAVFLDVVYNHLGPEGNYLEQYGPYFTDKYKTPWGKAINFDGPYSDGVREYFSNNPLYWLEHYHLDGLRLDAIHMIFDQSATSIWELMRSKVQDITQQMHRPFYLIAESNLNAPRVVQKTELGGYGFDAQWLDDFHHALYVLLDKAGLKFYEDYGKMEQLAKAFAEGFVHSGEFVKFRKRTFGASSAGVPGDCFVAFTQNHDQVGNRIEGERLTQLVGFERLKLAAAALLVSPYIPMLFMGEEYGEEAPFLYFVSHSDKELVKAVQKGRKEEFANYKWEGDPPDPQAEQTFKKSKLNWEQRGQGKHALLRDWYQALIGLRRREPALSNYNKADVQVQTLGQEGLVLLRQDRIDDQEVLCLFNFSEQTIPFSMPQSSTTWHKLLYSKDQQWLEQEGAEAAPAEETLTAGQHIELPALAVLLYSNYTSM